VKEWPLIGLDLCVFYLKVGLTKWSSSAKSIQRNVLLLFIEFKPGYIEYLIDLYFTKWMDTIVHRDYR
jgi:hypothetical protein